ncbi:MAG TPA: antitoxin Xre/MbcA/ParS toxin-binding domain-containing protein [Acidobacteriaceae bacterium]
MTAAAIAMVLGGRKTLRRSVDSDADLRVLTREGLPVSTLPVLAAGLDIERKTLAKVVGISNRTLSRRLAGKTRLSAEESDRTMRLARIMAQATETFESGEKAALWLKTPNRVMDGQTPLELLDTDAGVRWVETILGRIAWGVYS